MVISSWKKKKHCRRKRIEQDRSGTHHEHLSLHFIAGVKVWRFLIAALLMTGIFQAWTTTITAAGNVTRFPLLYLKRSSVHITDLESVHSCLAQLITPANPMSSPSAEDSAGSESTATGQRFRGSSMCASAFQQLTPLIRLNAWGKAGGVIRTGNMIEKITIIH